MFFRLWATGQVKFTCIGKEIDTSETLKVTQNKGFNFNDIYIRPDYKSYVQLGD